MASLNARAKEADAKETAAAEQTEAAAKEKSVSIFVGANQIHTTKNPAIRMVSIFDDKSKSGFSSFPVHEAWIHKAGDAFRVSLVESKKYNFGRAVGEDKDGKAIYEQADFTGKEIAQLYAENGERYRAAHPKEAGAEKADASGEKSAKNNVYLNRVSDKMIRDANGMKMVCVKDAESSTGWGSFLVTPGRVFPAKDKNGNVVEGRFNVNLGKPDSVLSTYMISKDDAFVEKRITAGELSSQYSADQKAFWASVRENQAGGEAVSQEAESEGLSDEDMAY